jgi:excisionase family DNA binding protein
MARAGQLSGQERTNRQEQKPAGDDGVMDAERLIDRETAAKWASVSERTIRRLCQRGELPTYYLGRRRLLKAGEVLAWINEQRTV